MIKRSLSLALLATCALNAAQPVDVKNTSDKATVTIDKKAAKEALVDAKDTLVETAKDAASIAAAKAKEAAALAKEKGAEAFDAAAEKAKELAQQAKEAAQNNAGWLRANARRIKAAANAAWLTAKYAPVNTYSWALAHKLATAAILASVATGTGLVYYLAQDQIDEQIN